MFKSAIREYFSEDGDGGPLNADEATEFFTGCFLGLMFLYKELTGDEVDLIDFVSLCNRLTFQYLQENGIAIE